MAICWNGIIPTYCIVCTFRLSHWINVRLGKCFWPSSSDYLTLCRRYAHYDWCFILHNSSFDISIAQLWLRSDVTSCFDIRSVQLWLRRSYSWTELISKELLVGKRPFYTHWSLNFQEKYYSSVNLFSFAAACTLWRVTSIVWLVCNKRLCAIQNHTVHVKLGLRVIAEIILAFH